MGYPDGTGHYTGNYSHLPKDCQEGIARFDRDCEQGRIKFDNPQSIMPTATPHDRQADEQTATFMIDHMMDGDVQP